MDLKTLEYMETRVNKANKIVREIDKLKSVLNGDDGYSGGSEKIRLSSGSGNIEIHHNERVVKKSRILIIDVIEGEIEQLEQELAEL